MTRSRKLLLAMSISVAMIGFVGLIMNIRAMIRSGEAEETVLEPVSAIHSSLPEARPSSAPEIVQQKQPKHPIRSKEELAQLLEKSGQESRICKANVAKARAKLSKTLMSAEEFKQALKLLEESDLTPPSSQEIYLTFEDGTPTEWDGAAFLDKVVSAGECDAVVHYKLLKSVVEKAATRPQSFPREQIQSTVRAFLFTGAEMPLPLLIELLRISLLKDLVQAKEIDAAFESRVFELDALGHDLMKKIQDDLHECQNASDCLKSLPNEFEQSKKVRDLYVRLINDIWKN